MTGAFSYFNTATGAVHLEADMDKLEASLGPSEAIEEVRRLGRHWWTDPPDLSLAGPVFSNLVMLAQRDLVQHELRHVHQLLLYPYLYLRGVRALVATGTVLDAVRQRADMPVKAATTVGVDLPVFSDSDPSAFAIKQSLFAPAARYWFDLNDEALTPVQVNLSNPGADYLTEQHLLEDEVAAYQYRLGAGPLKGAAFAAWRDQLPGDCPTYRFLREALRNEDAALRLLPLLVYWAYQTTIPMGAFVGLAQLLRAAPLAFDVTNESAVYRLAQDFIFDHFPRAGPDFPYLGLAQNDPPVRLDSDFAALRARAFHPCEPHTRSLEADALPRLKMIYPDAALSAALESRFPPPSIILRIHDIRFGPGSVGFSIYPHPERFPQAHDGRPWREVVLNLEYAYEAAQVLLFGPGRFHDCSQTACPARSGLCRKYPFPPSASPDCGYPKWLRDATGHEIDRENLVFRRIDSREAGT